MKAKRAPAPLDRYRGRVRYELHCVPVAGSVDPLLGHHWLRSRAQVKKLLLEYADAVATDADRELRLRQTKSLWLADVLRWTRQRTAERLGITRAVVERDRHAVVDWLARRLEGVLAQQERKSA